jgi:hypothetical protein
MHELLFERLRFGVGLTGPSFAELVQRVRMRVIEMLDSNRLVFLIQPKYPRPLAYARSSGLFRMWHAGLQASFQPYPGYQSDYFPFCIESCEFQSISHLILIFFLYLSSLSLLAFFTYHKLIASFWIHFKFLDLQRLAYASVATVFVVTSKIG